jgi:hypothetical protein
MSKLESGAIFKFIIPFDLGHGYCKIMNFTNVDKYHGITVYIYDFFDAGEINDVNFFKTVPLFMNPIPVVKAPSVRGKYAWKKIGVLKENKDEGIPFYKECSVNGFAFETLEEYTNKEWNVLARLKERIGPVNFNEIRHLEELFWRSTVTIEKRVAMQLLRYKQVDVIDFFTKNSSGESWKVDYNTQQFIPLYKKIPEVIKGKPLIKGFVPDEYLNFDWDTLKD